MSMEQSGMLAELGLFRTSACVVIHASLPTSIFYWPLSFQRRRNDLVFSSLSVSAQSLQEKLMMEPGCWIHRSQDAAGKAPSPVPQEEPPCASQPGAQAVPAGAPLQHPGGAGGELTHSALADLCSGLGAPEGRCFWASWTRNGPRNRPCWRQQTFQSVPCLVSHHCLEGAVSPLSSPSCCWERGWELL